MTVYHLIDALPAAFFGLLGIWAAVVRRHWFLRFAVVCVFLLVCLLIPAYEVVIDFGIAIALIMAGVSVARGFQRERFRFSLESALLAMVVVAIGSAVITKSPDFSVTIRRTVQGGPGLVPNDSKCSFRNYTPSIRVGVPSL